MANDVGADPPVVAGIVVASALLGMVVGPALLSRLGIRSPLARGLALGTISSGQGTAEALREGDLTGAAASVAVALLAMPLRTLLQNSTAVMLRVLSDAGRPADLIRSEAPGVAVASSRETAEGIAPAPLRQKRIPLEVPSFHDPANLGVVGASHNAHGPPAFSRRAGSAGPAE
ncbi:LrgB family protein [Cyanobium sp. Morenito 9A2]|uniref:LrgB family protein n=1 Tax=Cyanobium sp. Morenito 9A2 TaxID=2823718 RepID=UPI0028F46014|nr:LrgB family protein [Cyanobium sp. Morenito 9A2]MCP9848917.1 LrgB family protein [Cyanobium sp. Morenito 9A2]